MTPREVRSRAGWGSADAMGVAITVIATGDDDRRRSHGSPASVISISCCDFIPSARVERFIADGGVNGLASRQRINLCIGQVGPRADDAKLLPVYEIARNLADEFQR